MPHIVDNPDAVAEWLRGKTDLPEAKDLVVTALERALLREDELVVPGFMVDDDPMVKGYRFSTGWMSAETLRRIEHVVDWIVASVVNKAPWLDKLDAAGRPLKLTKLVSLDRAVFEADKAMRLSAGGQPKTAVGLGEVVFMDLDEGWKIVRMTSPEALDTESSRMQHCVGQGAYDRRLVDKSSILLSLRDPSGGPHATLEVESRTNRLVQIRGKQNRLPDSCYIERLKPCILDLVCDSRQMTDLGLARGKDGVLHDVGALPDVFEHHGALSLILNDGKVRMPAVRLSVDGDLVICSERGKTVVLPPALHVAGKLELRGDFVFPPGADLKIESAAFEHCSIQGLPDGLEIVSLLINKASLGNLPRGLRTERLDITRSDLTTLPDDIRTKILVLRSSNISSLPRGLELDELHVMDCCFLTTIPEDLRTRDLYITGSGITSLPVSLEVFRLDLHGCSLLKTLPDDLIVSGTAKIAYTPLKSLGARMKVVGELRLEGMKSLRRLPSDLVVGNLIITEF
jgi:hypothetical protein